MPNSIANKIKLPDSTIIEINDNRIIVSNPQSGQVLSYDSINDYWTNQTIDIHDGIILCSYAQIYSYYINGALIPGQLYLIRDYETHTTATNTSIANPYHRFCLIVLATKIDKLDCKAMAVPDDNYWNNSDLTKWQIWYDIENNIHKYDWADTSNGTGVIYRMIDEYGNDCPYDFKNIMFLQKLTDGFTDSRGTSTYVYTFNAYETRTSTCCDASMQYSYVEQQQCMVCECHNNIIKPYHTQNSQYIVQSLNRNIWLSAFTAERIGYPYTIKNNCLHEDCHDNLFQSNTINVVFQKDCHDNSFLNIDMGKFYKNIEFGSNCYKNVFNGFSNDISFKSTCHDNAFEYTSTNIIFGTFCYNNTFKNESYNITYGNYCYSNLYNYIAFNITYGEYCYKNAYRSTSDKVYNITYGNQCNNNDYYKDTTYITYGENCYKNRYENIACRINYGNSCYTNTYTGLADTHTYGSYCYSNSFTDSSNIFFGSKCYSNTFNNKASNIFFKTSCHHNSFTGITITSISLNNACQYITISTHYYRYITIEDGNQYITLNTPVDGSKYVQNIYIAHGVNNSTTILTISDLPRALAYRTTVARLSDNTIRKYCEDEDTWCAINVIDLRR